MKLLEQLFSLLGQRYDLFFSFKDDFFCSCQFLLCWISGKSFMSGKVYRYFVHLITVSNYQMRL